jgi:Transposase
MLIIGCDFHPGFQQVAIFDNQTGEISERRLQHREEAEQFYSWLSGPGVRVGMEACGHYPWFERLLGERGIELWVGDAARIRAMEVRKQKTDRRDAELMLQLLREDRFPRIWVPTLEERDVRQLLVHRHKQVQGRTRIKNQLQALMLGQRMHEEAPAVEGGGPGGVGKAGVAALRRAAPTTVAGRTGATGVGDRGVEPAGGRRSEAAAGGGAVDDASGSGAGDGASDGADAGSGAALRQCAPGGQLFWADPERAFQRRAAAVGTHQQAGQFVSALFAGGSGTDGGALRRRVGPFFTGGWRRASIARWPKWRWRASWPCGCT